MIKTILWDIDATILDFKTAESNSLKETFEYFGLGKCSDDMVSRYSAINQSYWEKLEKGEVTKPQVLKNRFVDFFELMGITSVSAEEFCRYYENGLANTILFIENSKELLKELSGSYKQYAVTNGAFNVQTKKLEKSGLMTILDGAFISDSVGFEKPSGDFFDYVLRNIEPSEKDEIIIVGDSLTSDMKGGNNAGIKNCWYNPGKLINNKPIRIDYEIHKLSDIKDILLTI